MNITCFVLYPDNADFFLNLVEYTLKLIRNYLNAQPKGMNHRRDSNSQSPATSSLRPELLHSIGCRRPMPYPLGHGGSLRRVYNTNKFQLVLLTSY